MSYDEIHNDHKIKWLLLICELQLSFLISFIRTKLEQRWCDETQWSRQWCCGICGTGASSRIRRRDTQQQQHQQLSGSLLFVLLLLDHCFRIMHTSPSAPRKVLCSPFANGKRNANEQQWSNNFSLIALLLMVMCVEFLFVHRRND